MPGIADCLTDLEVSPSFSPLSAVGDSVVAVRRRRRRAGGAGFVRSHFVRFAEVRAAHDGASIVSWRYRTLSTRAPPWKPWAQTQSSGSQGGPRDHETFSAARPWSRCGQQRVDLDADHVAGFRLMGMGRRFEAGRHQIDRVIEREGDAPRV